MLSIGDVEVCDIERAEQVALEGPAAVQRFAAAGYALLGFTTDLVCAETRDARGRLASVRLVKTTCHFRPRGAGA